MAMFDLDGGYENGNPWEDRPQTPYSVSPPETPQAYTAPTPDAPAAAPARKKTAEEIYAEMRAATGTPTQENQRQLIDNLNANGYNASAFMYGNTPSGNEININGQKTKFTTGNFGDPGAQWYDWGSNDQGGGGGGNFGGGGGNAYPGGSIFDDPATTDFMKLLMGRVNALNQPYQPPSYGGLTDYLKSYMEKLQGPAYTPQQMDLMQTQTLDPLSRERDAYRQRIMENASKRGLDPKSGIVQKQLSDAENQFEQIRTKTQAGFASKAIDLDRINAQQAASVGQMLANIEQANFNSNEQRANQALDISKMVPDLARQRMLDANTVLSGNQINPTSLLQMQQQGNQFDSQQTQNYLLGIGQLVPYLLNLFSKNNTPGK